MENFVHLFETSPGNFFKYPLISIIPKECCSSFVRHGNSFNKDRVKQNQVPSGKDNFWTKRGLQKLILVTEWHKTIYLISFLQDNVWFWMFFQLHKPFFFWLKCMFQSDILVSCLHFRMRTDKNKQTMVSFLNSSSVFLKGFSICV